MKGQFTDLSAVPVENTGITADQIVLSLAPREASDDPTSLESLCAYSALCTQETMSVELSGGAIAITRQRIADAVRYTCQFPLAPAMMLCERASSVEELQLSLDFLLAITHGQPWNLQQMEKGHFYAILSQLLRRKSKQVSRVRQSASLWINCFVGFPELTYFFFSPHHTNTHRV